MTDKPWQYRLPCSNAPQPGESLAGYLLNLAHRLDLPPAELIVRTGLKHGKVTVLDIGWATGIPDGTAARLAHTTGLTPTEVHDLTTRRYDPTIHLSERLGVTAHAQRWMHVGHTKFCPKCLASRTAPHPVWRVEWTLPWVVACTRHRTLLNTHCPVCNLPVGESGGTLFRSLVPHPSRPVTHPSACRTHTGHTTVCDARLDRAPTARADADLIRLQRRLLDAIEHPNDGATSLGQTVTVTQWLRDLRLVCVLLQLARNPDLLNNAYTAAAATYVAAREPNSVRGARQANIHTEAPTDPEAMAGLLLAADQYITGNGDPDTLATLADNARNSIEGSRVKAALTQGEPSDHLREVTAPTKTGLSRAHRTRLYTTRTPAYTANHVPAYLDEATYRDHFPDIPLAGQLSRPLRRYIPIALTRLVTGWNAADAGQHLGYSPVQTDAAIARASNAFDRLGHNELIRRTAQISDLLDTRPRVNWAARRAHFTPDWTIPDADWAWLQHVLLDARAARADTPWEQRRPAYSAWVWEHVTHGDKRNAPMIQTTTGSRQHTNGATKHLSDIVRRTAPIAAATVRELATRYAARIDASTATAHTSHLPVD